MKRFRAEVIVNPRDYKHLPHVEVDIAEKMVNFILENFKISEIADGDQGHKLYTIDLLIGDYSGNDEIIKRLTDLYWRVPQSLVSEVYSIIALFKGMDINENFKYNRK